MPACVILPQHAIADRLVAEALVAAALCVAAFCAVWRGSGGAGLVQLSVCCCQAQCPKGICQPAALATAAAADTSHLQTMNTMNST
jgi:hypothetical protein